MKEEGTKKAKMSYGVKKHRENRSASQKNIEGKTGLVQIAEHKKESEHEGTTSFAKPVGKNKKENKQRT